MQIHELNTFSGKPGETDFLAIDTGFDTAKISAERFLETKVNRPIDEHNQYTDGTAGQLLRSKGDGSTEWSDVGLPTDEQTAQAVTDWLDAHPEATTTVQDGSLTAVKFSNDLKLSTLKDYVTPEMFGAVGDGVTDDTTAVQNAMDSGKPVVGVGVYNVYQVLCTGSEYQVYNLTLVSSLDNIPLKFSGCDKVYLYGVTIRDITKVSSNVIGINVENVRQFFAERLTIKDLTSSTSVCAGLQMTGVKQFGIINSLFENIKPATDADGIKVFAGTEEGYIKGCYFLDTAKRGVKLQTRNVTIENCVFMGSIANTAIDAQYGGCTFKSCYISISTANGYALGVGTGCHVSDCYIENTNATGFYDLILANSYSGILEDLIVERCKSVGVTQRFLLDANGVTLRTVSFTDCTLNDSSRLFRCVSIENFIFLRNTHNVETKTREGTTVNLWVEEEGDFFGYGWTRLYGQLGNTATHYMISNGNQNRYYLNAQPSSTVWNGLNRKRVGDIATRFTDGKSWIYNGTNWSEIQFSGTDG